MARSHRKTPIHPMKRKKGTKPWKQQGHRWERRVVRRVLAQDPYTDVLLFELAPVDEEVFWKSWFGDDLRAGERIAVKLYRK